MDRTILSVLFVATIAVSAVPATAADIDPVAALRYE